MTRKAPQNYRGFSIEQELDGTFSVFRYGYMAGRKTEIEARAYIDWKRG